MCESHRGRERVATRAILKEGEKREGTRKEESERERERERERRETETETIVS